MIIKIVPYQENIQLFSGSTGRARDILMSIYPYKVLSGRGAYKKPIMGWTDSLFEPTEAASFSRSKQRSDKFFDFVYCTDCSDDSTQFTNLKTSQQSTPATISDLFFVRISKNSRNALALPTFVTK
jgi:hypothetical protein